MSKNKKTNLQLDEKIKYIGFDKDGVLINSFSAYTKEWGKIIKTKYNVNAQKAEIVFKNTAGQPTDIQLAIVLEQHNINLSKKQIFKQANEIAALLGKRIKAQPFPEIHNVLQYLSNNGFFLFVSSGQHGQVVVDDLKRANLIKFIDFYAGIRPNQPKFKKGLAHFRAASEYFKVPFNSFVKKTVFVGDTLEDIKVCNEAGITSICRSGTYSKKDLLKAGAKIVVPNLSKLSTILSNL